MPPRASTHHNPYSQGGWSETNPSWSVCSTPTLAGYSPPSSNTTAVAAGDTALPPGAVSSAWAPAQSPYGALPVPPAPGVPATALAGANYVLFRFGARNSSDFLVLAPHERVAYRVFASAPQQTVVVDSKNKRIARVEWHGVPVVQLHGRQMAAPQWLRQLPGKGLLINIRGVEYQWTFDSQFFYLYTYGAALPPVAIVANTPGGIEIKILTAVANAEFLENVIVAVIVIQGPRSVGL